MKTYLKECKWGQFLLLRGDMVSQYADFYGEWCELEAALFKDLLHKDSNVVEIGAHIGLHTVPLSKIADSGKVVCFEPQRVLYQMLCANCALNNRSNVYAFNYGLGNRTGTIDIASTDYLTPWNYGSFSLDRGFNTEGNFQGAEWVESTDIRKLDEVPFVGKLDSLSLIKIDVEGMEMDVVRGADKVIARHRPTLFVENNKEEKGDELIALIRGLGYTCYWYCAERFRPENYNKVGWKLPGGDFNIVCFPTEKNANAYGLMEAKAFADLKKGMVPWVQRKL